MLRVNVNRFKILKCKNEKYARLEFRGVTKYTSVLQDHDEIVYLNESFVWPLNILVGPGEVLTLHLLSRGRWGPSRVLGVYRLGLQIVVTDGQLSLTDTLVNERNKPVPVFVDMDVFYTPPVSRPAVPIPGTARRTEPLEPIVHINTRGSVKGSRTSPQSSPSCSLHELNEAAAHPTDNNADDDVDHTLLDLEKNIASIERAMQNNETVIDIESGDEGKTARFKVAGRRLLRRGFSFGPEKMLTTPDSEPKRSSTLKTVRNLMKLGRNRSRERLRDEEQGLLLDMPGPSTKPDRSPSPTSLSSDEYPPPRKIPKTPRNRQILNMIDTAGPGALKAADFQVCITIIEARQLAGLNMDPIVCVQVGDVRKFTSVKESTNCPYFNEYFVFDFHMPPIMLFDKIITLSILQSRNILRPNKLLGNFKLDVATVWSQPDRQFYHKWALLTDPDDIAAGPKGYLKCDISVIGKGDTVKIPPKSEKDEDDIEANLLLPDGVPIDRQRAKYIVKIHKADGLPKMNYSILANVKRAFTGESQDLVDPYVQVSFAGLTGNTSVKKNCYNPNWNEQIVFTEMFPPLCSRIKIQLRDNDPVHPNIIGTHFIDLKNISNDGEKGFLPTFGPAYVYLYGSTRDYSLIDQHASLNMGMGEGVSYRARLLVSVHTEITESGECPASEVEVEPILTVNEDSLEKCQEYFLFSTIFEANMIDKSLVDKHLQFELSIGNSGNCFDGHNESVRGASDLESIDLCDSNVDVGYWQSTTPPAKAMSSDKTYYYLPYWDYKHCMQVRSIWPDHRRRMYNSNLIANIVEKFEEGLSEAQAAIDADIRPDNISVTTLKSALEATSNACAAYVRHMTKAPPIGNTKLDKERQTMCLFEIDQMTTFTKHLKALVTKHSIRDRIRTAYNFLNRLKSICEDAQHTLPDVFLWLISNGKRLAYQRIPARFLIYSDIPDECGKYCGKMQTIFLKWPGKRATKPSGWAIPAQVTLYLWLGLLQDKKHYVDTLPPGYELGSELRNVNNLYSNAPQSIYYLQKHNFQLRAYVFQARSLIGSDSSGLSDPFARIVIGDTTATTQVIDETLSPTWDELLVRDDITLYSTVEEIKANPPTIIIEIFDQDKVGKSEFIGRTLAKPHIKAIEDTRSGEHGPPLLEWHEITRGDDRAGELLATFELLETSKKNDGSVQLPDLPTPREPNGKPQIDPNKGPILPVPQGIRPTLSKYRIEVLFWGLRDLKRVHLLTVDKPRVDIECAGHILYSTVIQNAKRNPNFTNPIKYVDVELPDQDLYRPPLTIRVVDCRSFGRITLVGTHTINSIHKYIYTPMSKRERNIEERKKSLIPLQNVDLRANCIISDDGVTIENEKESCPLLLRNNRGNVSYGSGVKRPTQKKLVRNDPIKKRKTSTDSSQANDNSSKDWWTKYFASVESMIETEKEAKKERHGYTQAPQVSYIDETRLARQEKLSPRSDSDNIKRTQQATLSSKISPTNNKKYEIPTAALTKIYPHELETVTEYEEFKEWLHTFDLYRGKKTGDDDDDENRVVGSFKGSIKVYKWPIPKGTDDHTVMGFDPIYGFFQGVPNNDPIHVLVRVYIVKATDLHPMDMNGKADPYIVLNLGAKRISDKDNYVSKQLNPVFGKCYEIEATFPQDSMLSIQVQDWDLLGSDDLIGETRIDLENRFYSRHRATSGLPARYEEQGYNKWRDALKPTQILAKLCKDGKLDTPVYEYARVKIGKLIFNMPVEDPELFNDSANINEQMALLVLHRWQEVPRVGTYLVREHVETRPLYKPNKPGIEQGRLEMWVDMFPMDMPLPGPPLDISPRKPKSYEMRVIIWNTDDVVLEDDAFFSGEKMSDIYVKGWLKGADDCQSTDIHYRSLTGEGNFNWRFIYPFDYLEAEERIVITRKESVFSWDESECKIPARLELQVWDADHFSADDFLGAITLDLNRFPRGAKSSKHCTLDMLRNDETVPMVNIFKQKRVKGWWPFYSKEDNMELTGKVEAEIHLLTKEEAEKIPAGLGRNEPDPLEKPSRPDSSFMWILNPLKSIRYIVWHNYKWAVVRILGVLLVAMFILLLFGAIPGYTIKKLLGA